MFRLSHTNLFHGVIQEHTDIFLMIPAPFWHVFLPFYCTSVMVVDQRMESRTEQQCLKTNGRIKNKEVWIEGMGSKEGEKRKKEREGEAKEGKEEVGMYM